MAYLKLSLDCPRLWWSKDENDEYLDLTWVSPNYTLETSKQKKAKGEVQFTSTFVRLLRWSPGKMFIFRAWSSILSGVESGKTKRQGRKAETLKKTVHLPYLYHFLSVDFKHISRLKIYRIFFRKHLSRFISITSSPNFSPVLLPAQFPRSTHYQFPSEHDEMNETWDGGLDKSPFKQSIVTEHIFL